MKREELVARAARAMRKAAAEDAGYESMARAALTAILEGLCEPSKEMLEAGGKAFVWPSDGRGGKTPAQSAATSFVAMLSTLDDRSTGGDDD